MKSVKIFSIMMALLLVVGNAFSAQKNRPSEFEKFLQTNVKGKYVQRFFDYEAFSLALLHTKDGEEIDTKIVDPIEAAKARAMQDKMNMTTAADKLIKIIQADARDFGLRSKVSEKGMSQIADAINQVVKSIFFGKSKSSATASAAQKSRPSQFEKFIQTDIKGKFFNKWSQYEEFIYSLKEIAEGTVDYEEYDDYFVGPIKEAKAKAMQDKMNMTAAADRVIKVIQADVRAFGLSRKLKEDDKTLRYNADLVDKVVRPIFLGKSTKSRSTTQGKKSNKKPSSKQQSSYKK